MRDRRHVRPSMTSARPRGLRFALPFRRNGAARGATTEGRLGIDLRGAQDTQRDALNAPFRGLTHPHPKRPTSPSSTAPRPRRVFPSPAVTLLLAAQVTILIVLGWALTSPVWEVRHIAVEGTRDQTLIRSVEALPLTGCNIFRCDLAGRSRQIEALPAVASAEVQATFPDVLTIVVTPRLPTLLLRANARAFVVARDGMVLGAAESDPAWNTAALPALDDPDAALANGTPLAAGTRLDATIVKLAIQLRMGVHGTLGDAWALRYDRDVGFTATGPGGALVRFGTPRDVAFATGGDLGAASLGNAPDPARVARGGDVQLAELRAILTALTSRGERAALIDLRWGGHPYILLAS